MTDEQAYIERLQPDYREPERSEGSLQRVVRARVCVQCENLIPEAEVGVICNQCDRKNIMEDDDE